MRIWVIFMLSTFSTWMFGLGNKVEIFEKKVPEYLEQGFIPGLSAAILENGKPKWDGTFGVKNSETKEKVTPETIFQAASLSKPVFAYICLRLSDRGLLDLDKPLLEILPNPRISHDPKSAKLTARHVLSHQSGLPNWGGDKLEFSFAPGEGFGYSGEGYVYLQNILEKLTGKKLPKLANEEVFTPLGMTHSSFIFRDDFPSLMAFGHNQWGGDPEQRTEVEANAAASLHTNARDYARFMAAFHKGEGLSDKARTEMTRRQATVSSRSDKPRAIEATEQIGWGLGWGLSKYKGHHRIWHWGDNGNFKALTVLDLSTGDGFVYFANGREGLSIMEQVSEILMPGEPWYAHWLDYRNYQEPGRNDGIVGDRFAAKGKLRDAVNAYKRAAITPGAPESYNKTVRWLEQLLAAQKMPRQISPEVIQSYIGVYGPRRLFLEDGRLIYQREGRDPFPLIPLKDNLFAMEGLHWFRIEIEKDGTGKPTAILGHYLQGDSDRSPRD